jgi:cytochrome P450
VLKTVFRMFKFLNPPEHRTMRHAVAPGFTPKPMAELRPFLAETAVGLLRGRDHIDVVRDFAHPLPIAAACEALGVPPAHRDKLGRWGHQLLKAADAPVPQSIGQAIRMLRSGDLAGARALNGIARLRRYGRRMVTGRVRGTRPSAATESVMAAVRDGTLSRDDAVSTWAAMLVGGVASTRAFIANSVYTLLAHPDQLALLRQDPSLLPNAIEELLRYDGPGMQIIKMAGEDVQMGDVLVRKGDIMHLLLAAANRDPAAYEDADRFDICRQPAVKHIAFATGIHKCPGDTITRLATEAALAAILPRLPDSLPPGFEPQWHPSFSLRELAAFPHTLRPPP